MFFKRTDITGEPGDNPERILNLTDRELDVLACLQSGKPIKKIAIILGLSPKTIKNHTYNMMQKTDKHSRVSLVELSERSGHVEFLCDRYAKLLKLYDFKNNLLQIAHTTVLQKQSCCIKCTDQDLFILLSEHLKVLNIMVLSGAREENCVVITIRQQKEGEDKSSDFILSYDGNYYRLFENILHILLPQIPFLERIMSNYITDSRSNFVSYPPFSLVKKDMPPSFKAEKSIPRIFLLLTFCGVVVGLASFWFYYEVYSQPLHSLPLMLPDKSYFLPRNDLLNCIDKMLSLQKKGVKQVFLTGVAGSGKTTLAREYAKRQSIKFTYELNAETLENFIDSLSNLIECFVLNAQALHRLKNIRSLQDMEKQILK